MRIILAGGFVLGLFLWSPSSILAQARARPAPGVQLPAGLSPDDWADIHAARLGANPVSQQAYLKASNAQLSDQFGQSVAISGGIGVVGANFEDSDAMEVDGDQSSNAAGWAGAVYVFDVSRGASATSCNAGSNPASFTANEPMLGSTWHSSVDLAGTTGHGMALLVGYLTPANITLGGGQVLLINIADPAGRIFTSATQPGPVASFALEIPDDPSLVGISLSTQAVHFGGVFPFALSNAQDLVLDY